MIRQITQPNLGDSDEPAISLKDEIKEALDLEEDSILDVRYMDPYDEGGFLVIEEIDKEDVLQGLEDLSEKVKEAREFINEELRPKCGSENYSWNDLGKLIDLLRRK